MAAHVHVAMGRDDFVRLDGVREVWWKCQCGLEEKRYFRDDACFDVQYRYQGRWAPAAEWLLLTVPMTLCPDCDGQGCGACGGVGVVETDGSPVAVPITVG